MTEEDRYWDTADRQNTAGEGITKKNPGARLQGREDNVCSLCGVRLCNKQLQLLKVKVQINRILKSATH
jgi:hypothetical protein